MPSRGAAPPLAGGPHSGYRAALEAAWLVSFRSGRSALAPTSQRA